MLQQVTNNINIGNFIVSNLAPEVKNSKFLPPLNSLVEVEILSFSKDIAKILIGGRVYQSGLPIKTNTGEKFLAKVINQNPLTLSLANFLNNKISEGNILSFIIEKFGLGQTANTLKVLKSFIGNNRPIIKSKLENFLDRIDATGENYSDEQIDEFVKILRDDDLKNESFSVVVKNSFQTPISGTVLSIFNLIKKITNGNISDEIQEKLNKVFFIEKELISDGREVQSKAKNSSEIISLMNFLRKETQTGERENFDKIRILLENFLIQKYYYLKQNIIPCFLIIKINGQMNLVDMKYQQIYSKEKYNPIKFNLSFYQEKQGEIILDGIYTETNLFTNFIAPNPIAEIITEKKSILVNELKKVSGLNSFFTVNSEKNQKDKEIVMSKFTPISRTV